MDNIPKFNYGFISVVGFVFTIFGIFASEIFLLYRLFISVTFFLVFFIGYLIFHLKKLIDFAKKIQYEKHNLQTKHKALAKQFEDYSRLNSKFEETFDLIEHSFLLALVTNSEKEKEQIKIFLELLINEKTKINNIKGGKDND